MNNPYLHEKEQITLNILEFMSDELKLLPNNIPSDLVINKGKNKLNSRSIYMILARIADNTGISMITLWRCFPYYRYFITTKISIWMMFGIVVLIMATITGFTDSKEMPIFPFLFILFVFCWIIALLKYIVTCFIRYRKPVLTVSQFIELILLILHKYRDELVFDVTCQERQIWRYKIYEIFKKYIYILDSKTFLPGLTVPLSDDDEYDMVTVIEECGKILSCSFEEIDQSGIYEKYTNYDEDELLTVVHFADLLIDFCAQKKRSYSKAFIPN